MICATYWMHYLKKNNKSWLYYHMEQQIVETTFLYQVKYWRNVECIVNFINCNITCSDFVHSLLTMKYRKY